MNSTELLKLEFKKLKPFEVFDYFDGPRLYSCKSPTNQIYLISWVDENDGQDEWLYVRVSNERYYSLKNRFINIRDSFLKPEDGYAFYVSVSSKENFSIEYKLPEQIDRELLPEEDEYLDFDQPSNTNLLPKKVSEASQASEASYRHVIDFALITQNNSYEVPASTLGQVLTKFQGFVESLGCDSPNSKRVPENIKESHTFNVTGLFESSFGIRLQSKNPEFFSESQVEESVQKALNILDTLGCAESLHENLEQMSLLTKSRFKGLLSELVSNKLSVKTEYANPLGNCKTSNSKFINLQYALNNLIEGYSTDTQTTVYEGVTLVGVDVNSDFFAIKLKSGTIIKGKLAKSLESTKFRVPSVLTVTLDETCKVNERSSEEKWTYTLVNVKS